MHLRTQIPEFLNRALRTGNDNGIEAEEEAGKGGNDGPK